MRRCSSILLAVSLLAAPAGAWDPGWCEDELEGLAWKLRMAVEEASSAESDCDDCEDERTEDACDDCQSQREEVEFQVRQLLVAVWSAGQACGVDPALTLGRPTSPRSPLSTPTEQAPSE
jgi:hypothetical protein